MMRRILLYLCQTITCVSRDASALSMTGNSKRSASDMRPAGRSDLWVRCPAAGSVRTNLNQVSNKHTYG